MKINNNNDFWANEMGKALEENKDMFSTASALEKLAFKRVSEEDAITEVESELLKKVAACCECAEEKKEGDEECKCECHSKKEASVIMNSFNSLLKISEDLDNAGFSKLAAVSAMLADKLVSEAKAAKSKGKSSKKETKKETKKVDMKERMKKMREMKGKEKGKKEDKKDSASKSTKPASKSSKTVSKSSPSKSSPTKSTKK